MLSQSSSRRLSGKDINWFKHFKECKNYKIIPNSSVDIKKSYTIENILFKDVVIQLYSMFKEFAKKSGNDLVLVEEIDENSCAVTIFQILDKENIECYPISVKSEIFGISLNNNYLNTISDKSIINEYPSFNLFIKKKYSSTEELKLQISNLIEKIEPFIMNQLLYYIDQLKHIEKPTLINNIKNVEPPPGFKKINCENKMTSQDTSSNTEISLSSKISLSTEINLSTETSLSRCSSPTLNFGRCLTPTLNFDRCSSPMLSFGKCLSPTVSLNKYQSSTSSSRCQSPLFDETIKNVFDFLNL
jgi:hypothetical protein